MLRKPVSAFFSLFIICCIALNVQADAPVVHLSPTPLWLNTYKYYTKKIPLRDVGKGFFYQLFEEQVQVEKQADYQHYVREIVSDAGIQNGSEIAVSFDPIYERLDFHQITIWRDNKPINRLSAGSFKIVADEQDLSKFIYQGSYTALCILDDIRKGDKIEYAYTIIGRNPIFNNKFSTSIYFQQSQPIAHLYKAVMASAARKLNFKYFNKTPKVAIRNKAGLTNYVWEDFQVAAAHDYNDQANWYTSYGFVQISDYNSWKEVVDWGIKLNPVTAISNGNLARQIDFFKKSSGNDPEKYFRAAVTFVQDEIRYMGIEMGEYSHRANNPEKVFNQRYGDCKDKSLLLASILNAGGIRANIVLINANIKSKVDQYLPSPFVFNHAVVVATVNNKQVYVDATISNQRGTGTAIYFPEYGKGLILEPGNNELNTINPSKTGEVNYNEVYTINADPKVKVKLDVTTTYTLNEADRIRDRLASASLSETEKNYLNYYTRIYPKIKVTDSITIKDDELANKVVTIEHYQISDFFKKDSSSNVHSAGFYANFIDEQLPTADNNINYPLALYAPCNINYTIKVVLPTGWSTSNEHNDITRNAYSFKSNISTVGDTLFLGFRLNLLQDFIPADKLDEYRADLKQIKDDYLSYTFTYSPDLSNTPFRLNLAMLITAVILVVLISFLGIKIYRTKTQEILFEPGANFVPLRGWLIVVAIGLGLSTLLIFVSLFTNNYFDLNYYNAHSLNSNNFTFKAFFTVEALGNTLAMCYAAFCFILLLNKRDISPKYIIGFYIFLLAFYIADFAFASTFNNDTITQKAGLAIFRGIIAACIWIPYFKYSSRVQQTLIVPYPANNYKYEELATNEPVI